MGCDVLPNVVLSQRKGKVVGREIDMLSRRARDATALRDSNGAACCAEMLRMALSSIRLVRSCRAGR